MVGVVMDNRVGALRDRPSCGYNSGIPGESYDPSLDCDALPVVVHFMFDTLDEEGLHPGGFGCEEHKDAPPEDLVKMRHSVDVFCTLSGSIWDFELNICIMPLEYYEEQLLGEVIKTELVGAIND
jgi:hypothetical protein